MYNKKFKYIYSEFVFDSISKDRYNIGIYKSCWLDGRLPNKLVGGFPSLDTLFKK